MMDLEQIVIPLHRMNQGKNDFFTVFYYLLSTDIHIVTSWISFQ